MIRFLEELSTNAWAPLQTAVYDGWILRFAEGYTKRANSVSPLYPSKIGVQEKIDECEKIYSSKELPTVFKITKAALPEDIDFLLEQRNYRAVDHTSVQAAELNDLFEGDSKELILFNSIDDSWVEAYCSLGKKSEKDKTLSKRMMQNIIPEKFYVSLRKGQKTVACGMGVVEHGYVGIFDIITDETERRKGYGEQIVREIMRQGKLRGAEKAYLQVVLNNPAALSLYKKLGFKEIYQYWYRVK